LYVVAQKLSKQNACLQQNPASSVNATTKCIAVRRGDAQVWGHSDNSYKTLNSGTCAAEIILLKKNVNLL
jgi:hypothetical protein